MKARFEGVDGNRVLFDAVKSNDLVTCCEELAKRLVEKGKVVEVEHGQHFIEQDAEDNDLYMIISGQADVYVNGRHIATRQARNFVGEMALLDPAAKRSATLSARGDLVLLRVTEPAFHKISQEFPIIWKPVAAVVAERLRQRARFHRTPNSLPELFIGCSVEGHPIAQEIQSGLKHEKISVTIWDQGIFTPSTGSTDALLKAVDDADFAVLVFSPDDKVDSRGGQYLAPRDNVVFELGLSMGGMGRERACIVKDHRVNIKTPSDLLGLTPIQYVLDDPNKLTQAIGPVCSEISKWIKRLGVR